MRKSVFKADYNQSTAIVTTKQITLNQSGFNNMKFRHRIVPTLLSVFFAAPLIFMLGTKMPVAISDKPSYFSKIMARYGTLFSPTIKVLLLIWIISSVLLLVERKNYSRYTFDATLDFSCMLIAAVLTMFNLLFGVAVAGVGLVGACVMVVAGLIFLLSTLYNVLYDFKNAMYGKQKEKVSFHLDRVVIASIVLTILSSLIFRPGKFNLLLYLLSFGLLLVFAGAMLLLKIMAGYFIADFYFVKYAEQYKGKFKITDEKWYGPRKAKRLAKKKRKR